MVKYLLPLVVACGKFQDPNIVVDLRVIALTATVPEQVVDVDITKPIEVSDLLNQLHPSEVCALVADPSFDGRRLRWSMTLCPLGEGDRCDDGVPHSLVASGILDDPDITVPEPRMCGTVQADGNLIGVVMYALDNDILRGLEGEAYEVQLVVGGEDADPSLDLYAVKSLQVIADIPKGRTPNQNPTLTEIDATLPDADPVPLPLGRCVDQTAPIEIPPATKIRLLPIEPDGVRETYTVAKLDGTFQTFTENLTYQWTAGAGGFSDGETGGPHDPFGNEPPLFSDYTSPAAKDLDGPTDVSIWVVQRDERLGAAWYESCIRVVP
jgi:hypothetical protein